MKIKRTEIYQSDLVETSKFIQKTALKRAKIPKGLISLVSNTEGNVGVVRPMESTGRRMIRSAT